MVFPAIPVPTEDVSLRSRGRPVKKTIIKQALDWFPFQTFLNQLCICKANEGCSLNTSKLKHIFILIRRMKLDFCLSSYIGINHGDCFYESRQVFLLPPAIIFKLNT